LAKQDFGDRMSAELQRQAQARLIAKTPLGQYWTTIQRIRTGAIWQPRYLIPAAIAAIFVVGSALVSCVGIVTAYILAQ
jgi:hypothetical protein